VLDYIPDSEYIPREAVLNRDSYADRWLRSIGSAGAVGIKYVPWRAIRRTEEGTHRFGHKVRFVPVTHPLVPTHVTSTRRMSLTGAVSPFHRLEALAFTLNLIREIKNDRVHLLHYANYFASTYVFSPLASLSVPVVVWHTGGDFPSARHERVLWLLALRLAMLRTSLVMIGEYPRRRSNLYKILGGKLEKVKTIQLLRVDRELFHPMDKEEAKMRLNLSGIFHIFCVQSLLPLPHTETEHRQPYLLLDTLANALPLLPKRLEVLLTIAGTGPGAEYLKKKAADLGIGDRVALPGRIEHENLPPYFSASDIVFVPFKIDALNESHVLAEAFASSRPVVAFRKDPRAPLDQPGGYLISDKPEQGARELAKIIGDASELDRKSKEAYSLSSSYDLGTAGSELVSLYYWALG
jgi:glycosyltransferase involved in cell wall biosynthesis